jgi:ABC-type nitrate/sulfonate/bicarbonate transport system substrate-binding protein
LLNLLKEGEMEENQEKSRFWIFAIIGVVIIALLVGGYFIFLGNEKEEKYSGPVEKITLGAETSLLTAAVWIADEKGFFEEYGLDLEIVEFESGKASFNDMLNNGVDISTVAPTPIMFNSFERDDFSIFATFVSSTEDVKVIARKDSGINQAKDLIGKKIGTPAGTTGQFFLSSYLTFRGVDYSEIEEVDISPSNLPNALNNGEVDAIVIWEPHAYNAINLLGGNSIHLPSPEVYDETFNFMVMDNYVENNPEVLVRFLKALDKATKFIENNKEESQRIVADRLKLDIEVMTVLWKDFVFDITLEQSLILTLEAEAQWAINNNLTEATEIPNYLDYINIDALREVKPESITITGYTIR